MFRSILAGGCNDKPVVALPLLSEGNLGRHLSNAPRHQHCSLVQLLLVVLASLLHNTGLPVVESTAQ